MRLSVLAAAAPVLSIIPMVGLATGALFPLLALDLSSAGFSQGFVGLVTSCFYAGSFLGAMTFPVLVRRRGRRASLILALVGLFVVSFLLSYADEEWAWLALRGVGGYLLAATYVITDSWVAALGDRRSRGQLMALYEILRLGAVALGPSLVAVEATELGIQIAAGVYLLALIGTAWSGEPKGEAGAVQPPKPSLSLLRCFLPAYLILTCAGFANSSFYALGAVYAENLGFVRTDVALFAGIVLFTPALTELPLGAIADRMRRMLVVAAIGAIALCASSAIAVYRPETLASLTALAVLVGGGVVPLYALTLSRIADSVDQADMINAAKLGLLFYSVGGISGPAASGAMMDLIGASGLYVALGATSGAVILLAAADLARRCCAEQPA